MTKKLLQNYPLLMVFSIVALVCLHGISSYTVDSEIWSISLSQFFFSPEQHVDSLYTKPLFHFVLWLFHQLPLGNLSHLYFVKFIFVIQFAIMNFLFYRLAIAMLKDARLAAFALLLLSVSPVWLAEGFRVRADFMALSFSLWAVLVWYEQGSFRLLKSVVLVLVSLSVTPKSYIWNLPLMSYIFFQSWLLLKPQQRRYLFFAVIGLLVLSGIIYQSFLPIRLGFRTALRFFIETNLALTSKMKFLIDLYIPLNFILKTKVQWTILSGLAGFSLALLVIKYRGYFAFVCVLITILLFVVNIPKTAFLFCCFVILLSLFASLSLQQFTFLKNSKVITGLSLILFAIACQNLFKIHQVQGGLEQRQFIADLETAVNNNDYRIFDSMGLLVRRSPVKIYLGGHDSFGNSFAQKYLTDSSPEMIILTDRIRSYLMDGQEDLLNSKYKEVGANVFVRKDLPVNEKISTIDPASLFNQRLVPATVF